MDVELITIGDELLLGFTIDTNAAHLARELASIGIGIRRRATVGDVAVDIVSVVREAIDRQYEQLLESSSRRNVEAIMKQIYERYPDPPGLLPRDYDVHDRDEAKSAVLRKLRRKRR